MTLSTSNPQFNRINGIYKFEETRLNRSGGLLNAEEKVIRNSNFIFRKIVDEMVLIPYKQDVADLNAIFTLNDLGAFIWEKLEQPSTRAELEQVIYTEYDVDLSTIKQDLEVFLDEMAEIGAISKV